MFCSGCQTIKAEAGCYMAGAETRVCLGCYTGAAGSVPLPSNAPTAFGGAFASEKRLAQYEASEAAASVAGKMKQAGKAVVAGAAGLREWRDEKGRGMREAKEAFWSNMPDEVQEYRNRLAKEIDTVRNPVREKVREAEENILDRANKLLDDLF